ncbi:MAG TPA: pseudaminic acid synthase [Acidimicrobiia bacterium]|nr:pseudaminic acid synthase [Acidimicrobiia bacterium]
MNDTFTIGARDVGRDAPVFCIAELSGNHNGSLERAIEMVRAAAHAGADAVKAQTYRADTITLNSRRPEFMADGLWAGRSLYELYEEASMPWEWQPELAAEADRCGVEFFSSVFDPSSVDFLVEMGAPCLKIASFELVDIPLIEQAAATGKPLIMSTGMATFAEIEEAVVAARRAGAKAIALLACTSAYPAPASDANLRKIPRLANAMHVVGGLSDHTIGPEVPIAATALGAKIIEKHFTLRRTDGGVDSAFSLEPEEFAAMVHSVRVTESALGEAQFGPTPADAKGVHYRRSLFVTTDVRAGEAFGEHNVRSVRPALGLHPRHLGEVTGRRAARDIEAGTPLDWSMLA